MNKRFDGFRNTPFLWEDILEGLEMYKANELLITSYPTVNATPHIRLGKLIEQFVLFELEQDASVKLLRSNVQVFRDLITIGELDSIIRQVEENIHLEIVYKYYLYDPSISTELDRWIGPNRKDSLVFKLNKLREKQLPLLYFPETAPLLDELQINATEIKQQLYFKAQLFVPFNEINASFPLINEACIKGFYIRYADLTHFTDHSFYIPSKLDWLVEPHPDVTWFSAQVFLPAVSELLSDHKSPLCWMKSPEGVLQKLFMVWWE